MEWQCKSMGILGNQPRRQNTRGRLVFSDPSRPEGSQNLQNPPKTTRKRHRSGATWHPICVVFVSFLEDSGGFGSPRAARGRKTQAYPLCFAAGAGFQGFPLICIAIPWISTDLLGFQWISIGSHGFSPPGRAPWARDFVCSRPILLSIAAAQKACAHCKQLGPPPGKKL